MDRVFTLRSDKIRSRESSTPTFTDRVPNCQLVTQKPKMEQKKTALLLSEPCTRDRSRVKQCVNASRLWIKDRSACTVLCTDSKPHSNIQNLFSHPNVPPPSALFQMRRLAYGKNTNAECGVHVPFKRNGQSLFQCAAIPHD